MIANETVIHQKQQAGVKNGCRCIFDIFYLNFVLLGTNLYRQSIVTNNNVLFCTLYHEREIYRH